LCRQIEKKERQAKLQERAEVGCKCPQCMEQRQLTSLHSILQLKQCNRCRLDMQRRQALREKLNLDQFDSDPDAPDTSRQAPCKDAAKPSQVSIHNLGDYTSVVTVEPFGLDEDR